MINVLNGVINESYTVIDGVWKDDLVYAPPQGWVLSDENDNTLQPEITNRTGSYHHGPYTGDTFVETECIYTHYGSNFIVRKIICKDFVCNYRMWY